eukprot:2942099-Rhodomonas_salina.1
MTSSLGLVPGATASTRQYHASHRRRERAGACGCMLHSDITVVMWTMTSTLTPCAGDRYRAGQDVTVHGRPCPCVHRTLTQTTCADIDDDDDEDNHDDDDDDDDDNDDDDNDDDRT